MGMAFFIWVEMPILDLLKRAIIGKTRGQSLVKLIQTN